MLIGIPVHSVFFTHESNVILLALHLSRPTSELRSLTFTRTVAWLASISLDSMEQEATSSRNFNRLSSKRWIAPVDGS